MDLLSRPVLTADHRIPYGPDPSQFGDLWLPRDARQPSPVVAFFHGGWWKSEYDLGYAGALCDALRRAGIACWSIEYRRVGSTGGGWPHTFQDAAAGMDFLRTVAEQYPIDLSRVISMGHSAGGHLAFWVAARHHIPPGNEVGTSRPQVGLCGAVALAGAVDLRLTIDLSGEGQFAHDREEVYGLMGGTPENHPDRYRVGNPGDLLPLPVAQVLVQGTTDDQIPPSLPAAWKARRQQAEVKIEILPDIDHLDVADPTSAAWPVILKHSRRLLKV